MPLSLGTSTVITMLPAELDAIRSFNNRAVWFPISTTGNLSPATKPLPWMVICWPGTTIAGWIVSARTPTFSEAVADGSLAPSTRCR